MRTTSAAIAILASFFATQAIGADTTPHWLRIKNYNCVWQGLVRTNQVKIHVWRRAAKMRLNVPGPFGDLPSKCTDDWVTIHAGKTAVVKLIPYIQNAAYDDSGPALECTYEVESEGTWSVFHGGYREYSGIKDTNLTCKLKDGGFCWCE